MLKSMYSGVSGVKEHLISIDVVANNISNINTYGFKKSVSNFKDLVYQTYNSSTSPSEERGGINAKQVGLGVSVASISNMMTQGSLKSTGRNTDLSISGEGFFVSKLGSKVLYSRDGRFSVDSGKNLVTSSGFRVQGWNSKVNSQGEYIVNKADSYENVLVPIGDKFEARSTKIIKLKSNLNSSSLVVPDPNIVSDSDFVNGSAHRSSVDIYDAQGKLHKVGIVFSKVDINKWKATVDLPSAINDSLYFDIGEKGNVDAKSTSAKTIYLSFDNKGAIMSISQGEGESAEVVTTKDLSASLFFELPSVSKIKGDQSGDTIALDINDTTNTQDNEGESEVGLDDDVKKDKYEVKIDLGSSGMFNGVTQMSGSNTTKAVFQDGYGMGYLESFKIDSSGDITGIYTNGKSRVLAKLAVSTFINPEGLEKYGDNSYISSSNSGMPNIGSASSEGKGAIVAGSLEMSNVDLADSLTNLMTFQRGVQASVKVITTGDQIIQEMLSIKR